MLKNKKNFASFKYLVALGAAIAVLCVPIKTNAAASNPTSTYIVQNNDFYAYVQASENIDISFIKQINVNGGGETDAVITVSRPGAADSTCTILAASAATAACNFPNQTASSSGIWHINFTHTSQLDYFSWSIGVQTGVTDIPGRAWSSTYSLAQLGGAPPVGTDFSVWFQSEFGYLYKASYFDYNGIFSLIQANGPGLVNTGGGCDPHYKSVNLNAVDFANAPSSCNPGFKLFYEAPAGDLPTSATQWDTTTDWVMPAIATPTISNLGFSSTTTNSRDGNITFDITDYTGPSNILIDTNNDHDYTDPEDVTIPSGITVGANSVAFDGLDGLGNPIPDTQTINYTVSIAHTAEIHFLTQDVELRGGGIEVTRLNGPSGGENTLFWDDTDFANPDANRCSVTSQPDGTAGVDSTGGVHTWSLSGCAGPNFGNFNNFINGAWGDSRTMDEWAYVDSSTSLENTLAGFVAPPIDPIDPTPISAPNTGLGGAANHQLPSSLIFVGFGLLGIISATGIVFEKFYRK